MYEARKATLILLFAAWGLSLNCGNLMRENLLSGNFGTVDNNAPLIVAPENGGIETGLTTTLIWGKTAGAMSYTIEIATDQDFINAVAGSPFKIEPENYKLATSLSLDSSQLSEGQYYWRVRSDKTDPGKYAEASFYMFDDAVYLYCPQTETSCTDNNTDHDGSRDKPYHSFTKAMYQAKRYGLDVKVAARGGSAVYNEFLLPVSGVKVSGGYTNTDWSRDITVNETIIETTGTTGMLAENLGSEATFTMDGFTFNLDSSQSTITGIQLTNSGTFNFKNMKINVDTSQTTAIGINAKNTNLVFENVDLDLKAYRYNNAVIADGGSFNFDDLVVTMSKTATDWYYSKGIEISSCSSFKLTNSNLTTLGIDSYLTNNWSASNVSVTGCDSEISGNTFAAGDDADAETLNSYLVKISGGENIIFTNNASSTAGNLAIDLDATGSITFSNNNLKREVSIKNFNSATISNNTLTNTGFSFNAGSGLNMTSNTVSTNTTNAAVFDNTYGTVSGNTLSGTAGSASEAIKISNNISAELDITQNTIDNFVKAISATNSKVKIYSNTLNGRNSAETNTIYLNNSSGNVYNNTILSTKGGGRCYGVYTEGTAADALNIYNNKITISGCSQRNAGMVLNDTATVNVYNNLFTSANTNGAFEYGVYLANGNIINNTIYFENSDTNYSAAIYTAQDATSTKIINNIFFASGTGNRVGIRENVSGGAPAVIRNNNFFDLSHLYMDKIGTLVTDLTTAVTTGEGSDTLANYDNISVDNSADQLFESAAGTDTDITTLDDNDWRLKATAPAAVLTGGLNGSASAGNFGFETDYTATTRSPLDATATGWSIGAYEQ